MISPQVAIESQRIITFPSLESNYYINNFNLHVFVIFIN